MKALDIIETLGATLLAMWCAFEVGRCLYQGGDMIWVPISVFIVGFLLCCAWLQDIFHRGDEE